MMVTLLKPPFFYCGNNLLNLIVRNLLFATTGFLMAFSIITLDLITFFVLALFLGTAHLGLFGTVHVALAQAITSFMKALAPMVPAPQSASQSPATSPVQAPQSMSQSPTVQSASQSPAKSSSPALGPNNIPNMVSPPPPYTCVSKF